jgi:CheY-like chemotaxis protein
MTAAEVLVVADADGFREMLREILESAGVRVTEAKSASDALSAARSIPFDVVVTESRRRRRR